MKGSDSKIAIVSLVALSLWIFVALPLIYAPEPTTDRLLRFAPLLTPAVASVAAIIAVVAISAQKSIARKRAAIDFFLKTDLDHNMLEAYADFEKALKNFKAHTANGKDIKTFIDGPETGKDYKKILRYLNVHELVAVGIKNNIFDERVCYNFWSDAMVRHVRETRPVIEYEIEDGGSDALFLELRTLSARWSVQIADWNRNFGNGRSGKTV
ncbi:DUF4760 domain-containing protein [Bradyrhizobium diazoefficiens]|uniref:DUF4760 domain-containing protein n=1 Tax=Bradyrhizobium diazoefficiens TaxID=1355477 RepID=UPI003470CFB1